jgi:hypothetical protein
MGYIITCIVFLYGDLRSYILFLCIIAPVFLCKDWLVIYRKTRQVSIIFNFGENSTISLNTIVVRDWLYSGQSNRLFVSYCILCCSIPVYLGSLTYVLCFGYKLRGSKHPRVIEYKVKKLNILKLSIYIFLIKQVSLKINFTNQLYE